MENGLVKNNHPFYFSYGDGIGEKKYPAPLNVFEAREITERKIEEMKEEERLSCALQRMKTEEYRRSQFIKEQIWGPIRTAAEKGLSDMTTSMSGQYGMKGKAHYEGILDVIINTLRPAGFEVNGSIKKSPNSYWLIFTVTISWK